ELPPLALYIHIPWCVRKCPYCDFNSHEQKDTLPEDAYVDALLSDLSAEMPRVWGRSISSVFIGGGTPSLFSANALDNLFSGIRALTALPPNVEVTMEANPGTFEQEKFKDFREIGINRLSIGIQSFNDKHLKTLGRIHASDEAIRAVDIAKRAGFEELNIDLMFGLPEQTQKEALEDVQTAGIRKHLQYIYYELRLNTPWFCQNTHRLCPRMTTVGKCKIKACNYSVITVTHAMKYPRLQSRAIGANTTTTIGYLATT
ncbi:UNVERIFIED_CONTAM: hypothetical protein GTU68_056574, partial [Idotea baltica]|nr:hypothetical protein [Idotea baltica]